MQAKDIMTSNVECIAPDSGIIDAAKKMKALDVGFLAVCEGDHIAGAVTDRDIVLRVVAEGRNLSECRARDIMTNEAHWCFDDQDVDEVARFMADKEIRRVLLLNRDKRLVGVLSLGDLAKARGEEKTVGKTMRDIAEAPPSAA
jgi:CBS domain-containing protein